MTKTVRLPGGPSVPALGLGTWRMGESKTARAREVAAVREAIALGYRLIDTAEMYGEGAAESIVGEAVRGAIAGGEVDRASLFIVSKVYPHNASRRGVVQACERSLERLGLDQVDLYLLHWPGSHPLADTVAGFETLQSRGLIARWGVSNFDIDDMEALWRVDGGSRCATNQVWYSVTHRGIEFDLLPWLQDHEVSAMAYSPIDQAALARDSSLAEIARPLGCSAAQLALAWTMRSGRVMSIPKAVRSDHLRDNLAAAALDVDDATLASIDAAFPPPRGKTTLAIN